MICVDDWENNYYDDLTLVYIHLQNSLSTFYFFPSDMLLKMIKYAIPDNEIKPDYQESWEEFVQA